ncbi:MAG: ABC transporter permease subunit [Oscillospiraceae bacterium]|nr:ABC transporter permease subunit [Oscillospiraceae bacterium]
MKNTPKKDILREELVQSPGRTALKNFLSRKLSVAGMIVFVLIFVLTFGLSFILPIDMRSIDSTRKNLPPAMNYLSLPNELKDGAEALSFGATFGAGTDSAGKLYIWGTFSDTADKIRANFPKDLEPVRMVACGLDHIVVVGESGEVYAWGNDRLNITNIAQSVKGKNIVDVRAGFQSTVALDDTGKLHFWGNTSMFYFKPGEDQGNFQTFDINISTAIASTKDGRVVCLSPADSLFANVPEAAQGRTVDVASTDEVGAAVLDDGTVVTWGQTAAKAYTVPEEIQGQVSELKGGRTHFTALLRDGSVASWGDDSFGQTDAPGGDGFRKIAVSYNQNAAVGADGKTAVWGQRGYLMGTDAFGRDIATRLIYGGRVTLTVGFISVIITAFIGILVGGFSGYFGGKVDMFLMRFAEIVSSIPQLPLMMILSSIVVNNISETGRVVMIMVILGILNWPGLARLTRAQILAEKENEFVTAAKAMGIRERVIIFRHILPNVLPVVLVSITLSMATCMLIESSLSFLGFGVVEPTPTWGNMLNSSMDSTTIKKYWWRWVFPSLSLGLATISINIMGDGLRDAIDPKSNDR